MIHRLHLIIIYNIAIQDLIKKFIQLGRTSAMKNLNCILQILLNKKYTNKSEFENDFETVKKTFPDATLVEVAY